MVIFLANRGNLQTKKLHNRLKHRLQSDTAFSNTRMVRASPRDPGQYRVKAETNPQAFLNDPSYPATTARLECGFDLFTTDSYEHYWINWIEPDRNMLVGWHQDEMHSSLGEVHLQINDGDVPVVHESAVFIDSHPLDVFSQRLASLPDVVNAVEWSGGRPVGFDW